MFDLFSIAVLILSLLLAPAQSPHVWVDIYDPDSGEVQKLEVLKTNRGFRVLVNQGAGLDLRDTGNGTWQVMTSEQKPVTVDLAKTIAAIQQAKKLPATFEVPGGRVLVSRTSDVSYVRTLPTSGKSRVFVVRSGEEPTLTIHPTKAGAGDWEGWDAYGQPWIVNHAIAVSVKATNNSPEAAVVKFLCAVLRDDAQTTAQSLSPKLDAKLRERLLAALRGQGEQLGSFSVVARATRAKALQSKNAQVLERVKLIESHFGGYDAVFLGSVNLQDDLFLSVEQVDGQWYVKGVGAAFVRPALGGPSPAPTPR